MGSPTMGMPFAQQSCWFDRHISELFLMHDNYLRTSHRIWCLYHPSTCVLSDQVPEILANVVKAQAYNANPVLEPRVQGTHLGASLSMVAAPPMGNKELNLLIYIFFPASISMHFIII